MSGILAHCKQCSETFESSLLTYHNMVCEGTRVVYGWRAGDELTAQQEREEIEGAMSLHLASGLKLNQPFFLLSVPWYKAWVEHAHNKASHRPPPISNADLLDDSAAQLRRGLAENYDYMIVNAHVWARFHAWYGGGPEIKRRVVRSGVKLVIDLYPVTVEFVHDHTELVKRSLVLASSNTLKMVRHWVATVCGHTPHSRKMHIVTFDNDGHRMVGPELSATELLQTVEEAGLGPKLVLEFTVDSKVQDQRFANASSFGIGYSPARMPENEIGQPLARGVVGLCNLGNTCFMNSTLQCLSAVSPLLSLLALESEFAPHLNTTGNPNSSKGELARSLSRLFGEMWGGQCKVVAPNDFKKVLSSWAPQFRGYQQHDAQEMLLVLLNFLHEDLCDLKSKKENSTVVSSATTLSVCPSPIASLFAGMYRSILTCESCGTESVAFEPFLNLSLPLPEKERRKISVCFVPLHGPVVNYGVRVNKNGNTRHIMTELAAQLKQPGLEDRLVGVQLSGKSGAFEMGPGKSAGSFRDRDVAVISEVAATGTDDWITGFVFSFGVARNRHDSFGGGVPIPCGVPIAVSLRTSESGAQAVERIRDRMSSITMSHLKIASVRLCAFGGAADSQKELPLMSNLDRSSRCFAVIWDSESAESIAKLADTVIADPSCNPGPEDEELTAPLADCFNLFNVPELISLAEAWVCTACKTKRAAVKVMTVWKAPPVLCLHLKRFKMDFVTREKLHTLVSFPQTLDMSRFVTGEASKGLYQLVGVCNHVGGLSGGHYTSFARVDGAWYDFNDRHVAPVSEDKIVTSSAYVLYYVHHDILVGGMVPPLLEAPPPVANAPEEGRGDTPSKRAKSDESSDTSVESGAKNTVISASMINSALNAAMASSAASSHSQEKSVAGPFRGEEERALHMSDGGGNLSDSAYLCEACGNPIQGGWSGLTQHLRQAHNIVTD